MTSQGKSGRTHRLQSIVCTAIITAGLIPCTAFAQKLTTIVDLDGKNGSLPATNLIVDHAGNLIGTTLAGGLYGNGVVFEIKNKGAGYSAKATALYDGQDTYGSNFAAPMMVDAQGNLIGEAIYGGTGSHGTIFEITKKATGYAATPKVLVSFDGANGAAPYGGLIADASGNLFGTASSGGAYGLGVVFEITKTAAGYSSTPTVLASFDQAHGANPYCALLEDAAGNLFGTTQQGGASNAGTVFEISKTADGYASTPTTLLSFDYANGSLPQSALIADAAGNLFGTALGGGMFQAGVVFELAKVNGGYASTPDVLLNLDNSAGASPAGALLMDANGNLFSTASAGGSFQHGTVFEITKNASGYSSTPTILINFDGVNGATPHSTLIVDATGRFLGTTQRGGTMGDGTVFEIF